MSTSTWLLLITLSILWGGSFFFVAVAVDALPPLTIVALRVGLAALILNIVLLVVGLRMPKDAKVWSAFIGMGLLNNAIPFCLIVWGQTHIASGLASILNATAPIFTVLVAHFWTSDERMSGGRLFAVLLGFVGVATMMGPDALSELANDTVAQLAVLTAAFSYACAGVFGRRFKKLGVAPMVTATGQLIASAIMLIPLALVVDQPWGVPMPSLGVWGAILGLATLSTALAYILYFRILATSGATNLLLVTFLIPISAILLGTTLLGEQLEPKHFYGMGLIGLGLAAIDGRPLNWIRKRTN